METEFKANDFIEFQYLRIEIKLLEGFYNL